tara:strand:- start:1822 stop:2376 length:555 start_codon:yes stop_codon:yes gene_type:complete
MSRAIDAATIAELAKDSFVTAHLVKIDFSTAIYLTENSYAITLGGNTYAPSSSLKGISNINESSEVNIASVSITLSGVSQDYISILLSESYIDRKVTIHRALLNATGGIIGNPILVYDGRMQSFSISDSTSTSQIVLTASSHWSDFEKKSGRRTNHNSQQIFFAGDKGFEFAPNTVKDLKWGIA